VLQEKPIVTQRAYSSPQDSNSGKSQSSKISQESSSQIFQINCEVDTGASCNILPLHKAKALFGEDLKLGKPTVNLKGYNHSPVENLGSCIVYLYHGNKVFS